MIASPARSPWWVHRSLPRVTLRRYRRALRDTRGALPWTTRTTSSTLDQTSQE